MASMATMTPEHIMKGRSGKDYISPKYKTLPGTFQCKSGVE